MTASAVRPERRLGAKVPGPDAAPLPATPSHRTRQFPARLSHLGAQLLHLQCWLWGEDIKREEGNLLLAAGMERLRPPEGVAGCSQYSIRLGEVHVLKLWGFGFYSGHRQGCYLNRFDFIPRRAGAGDCWSPRKFEHAPRTLNTSHLPAALRWMSAYEENVVKQLGCRYRRRLAARGPKTTVAATSLSRGWTELAMQIETWMALSQASHRENVSCPL